MDSSDSPTAEQLKQGVHQDWTDAASAWRKWNAHFVTTTRAATEAIVQAVHVQPGMHILDVGTGTGEPALTLAEAVGPDGHVTATDLVPAMLTIAEEEAQRRGLTNITFRAADGEALPFPDQTFDAYTCRFAVMFFPDVAQGLREARRVLKPGGRAALTAFGPFEQNPYASACFAPMMKRVQLPPPDPRAPNPFKFARPGSLAAVLRDVGFQDVEEESRQMRFQFPGSPEQNWEYHHEIGAAAFRRLLASVPPEQMDEVEAEVLAGLREYYDGQRVNFPAVIVLATATR